MKLCDVWVAFGDFKNTSGSDKWCKLNCNINDNTCKYDDICKFETC